MAFFEHDIQKPGFGLMRLPQKDGRIDMEPAMSLQQPPSCSGRRKTDKQLWRI